MVEGGGDLPRSDRSASPMRFAAGGRLRVQLMQAQAPAQAGRRRNLSRYQTLGQQDSIAKQQVDAQAGRLMAQYTGAGQKRPGGGGQRESSIWSIAHVTAPVFRPGRPSRPSMRCNYVDHGATSMGLVSLTQIKPITVGLHPPPRTMFAQVGGAASPLAPTLASRRPSTRGSGAEAGPRGALAADRQPGGIRRPAPFAWRAIFPNDDESLYPKSIRGNVRNAGGTSAPPTPIVIPSSGRRTGGPARHLRLCRQPGPHGRLPHHHASARPRAKRRSP